MTATTKTDSDILLILKIFWKKYMKENPISPFKNNKKADLDIFW